MKILYRIGFIIFMLVLFLLNSPLEITEVVFILVLLASNIFRLKYFNNIYTIALEMLFIAIALHYNSNFIILFGICVYDLVSKGYILGVGPIVLLGYYSLSLPRLLEFYFVIFLTGFFAYVSRGLEAKENRLKQSFDEERKARYELEEARSKLLHSSKEIAHLAEIKERNRIAREVHDNVGHSIAGLLMQLQVVEKLQEKDAAKSKELLRNSIEGLSDALVLLRETVHNIKPKESLGLDYIRSIVDHFVFCPINLKITGNCETLTVTQLELIATIIKEALTNAAKHSRANLIDIFIDINEVFVRLYIKDNGVGCEYIKDNLGLRNMKDRIRNIGGSITFSSNDGFMIVCIIPHSASYGGGIFEGINS